MPIGPVGVISLECDISPVHLPPPFRFDAHERLNSTFNVDERTADATIIGDPKTHRGEVSFDERPHDRSGDRDETTGNEEPGAEVGVIAQNSKSDLFVSIG